jgi:hypothetical protein
MLILRESAILYRTWVTKNYARINIKKLRCVKYRNSIVRRIRSIFQKEDLVCQSLVAISDAW